MSTDIMRSPSLSLNRSVGFGIIAGLIGGVAFGILMAMMNFLPMVAMLIGQESPIVGFVVHMVISAFIGATYGVIASRLPSDWSTSLIAGGAYGIVWWVLGALILMPLMLGMSQMVLRIENAQIMSLIGHIVYGVITGGAFKLLVQRS